MHEVQIQIKKPKVTHSHTRMHQEHLYHSHAAHVIYVQ